MKTLLNNRSYLFPAFLCLAFGLAFGLAVPVRAQVSVGAAGVAVSQNFNGLASSGSSTSLPTGWVLLEQGAGANASYAADNGGNSTGNTYAYGSTAAPDRALGALRSAALAPLVGASFVNNSADTFIGLDIAYTGEQWRLGGTGRFDRLYFQYSTNATALTDPAATWTAVTVLDFVGKLSTGSVGAKDGNSAANRDAISGTIANLSIAPSETFWIRWVDQDVVGADDGLAVDDFTLTATGTTVPPATTYYSVGTGLLNQLSTWNTASNGSGTAPGSFTAPNRIYRVGSYGSTAHTLGANWTVSGLNAGVVVAGGNTFSVPAAFDYSGPLDLEANATLSTASPVLTNISFGKLHANSTVVYAQTVPYEVPAAPTGGWGNLLLRNATKTLPYGDNTRIEGNLTLDNVSGFGGTTDPGLASTSIALKGNLTLTGTVAFASAGLCALVATRPNPGAVQTLNGNGTALRLRSLSTLPNTAGLALAPGTTDVTLGDAVPAPPYTYAQGGGLRLATGTALSVDNNTLAFAPASAARLESDAAYLGTLTVGSGSNLLLARTSPGGSGPGTLRFTGGVGTLNNLTLDSQGGTAAADSTFVLASSLIVGGTLALPRGLLSLPAGGTLTVGGPLSTGRPRQARLLGSATTNLVFSGTGALDTLSWVPSAAQVFNLNLSRSANVLLPVASSLTVNGLLTFTRGWVKMLPGRRLAVVAGQLPTGGGANSYVNRLTLSAVTNNLTLTAGLTFPLGLNGQYRPLTLTLTDNAFGTAAYTAEQHDGAASSRPIDAPLVRVSGVRYFEVRREPGATSTLDNAEITLTYNAVNDLVNDDNTLRLAHSAGPGSAWESLGGTGNTTTITSDVPFASFGDFTLGAEDFNFNPLPVTLTAFAATAQAADVYLTWATASERNSAYFEVQRSPNGQRFEALGRRAAAGSSTAPLRYEWLDANALAAPQTLYYRLRQVDFDGKISYSPVVAVRPGKAAGFACYPNPTPDALTLLGPVALAGQPVQVLDLSGRLLRQVALPASGQLSLAELPGGTYLVRLPGLPAQRVTKL